MDNKEPNSQFYIAESLGSIKGELVGIKEDIAELKLAIEPLKKKVYYTAGKIAIAGILVSVTLGIFGRYIIEKIIGGVQ